MARKRTETAPAEPSPTTRGRRSPSTRLCSRSTPSWASSCWKCGDHGGMAGPCRARFCTRARVLADAVDRSLRDKANVRGLHPRQLHVFDALDRDDRGWVLSVAHVDVVRLNGWHRASRYDQTHARRRPGASALRPRRHHRHGRSITSDRTTPTSPTRIICSATSSHCVTCGSRTRP